MKLLKTCLICQNAKGIIQHFGIYAYLLSFQKLNDYRVYHCVTSAFLLTTLSKDLGREDTNCF